MRKPLQGGFLALHLESESEALFGLNGPFDSPADHQPNLLP